MASTTYTLTATQLSDFLRYWKTLERTSEYKQLIAYMRKLDQQYIAGFGTSTYGLNANQLDGHSLNASTGVMTVNTADAVEQHELPYFR
jgi:hypothetical protein